MFNEKVTFSLPCLKSLVNSDTSCVSCKKNLKRSLMLKPIFLNNLKQSVCDLLASKVTTYDIELGGIILSYKNIKINNAVEMKDEDHFILDYVVDIYVFTPQIGSVLTGRINKKGRDVLGCLVHSIFNVALPRPRSQEDSPKKWLGSKAYIGQTVTFSVVKLDFTGRLPYIRGKLLSLESNGEADDGADSGMGYQESIEEDCSLKESDQYKVPDIKLSVKRKHESTVSCVTENPKPKKMKIRANSSDEGLSGEESICADTLTIKSKIVSDPIESNCDQFKNVFVRKKKKKSRHSGEIETHRETEYDRALKDRELESSLPIPVGQNSLEPEGVKKEKKKRKSKSEDFVNMSPERKYPIEENIEIQEKKKRKKHNRTNEVGEISNRLLEDALKNLAVKVENIRQEYQTFSDDNSTSNVIKSKKERKLSSYEQIKRENVEGFNLETVKNQLLQETLNIQNDHEKKSIKIATQSSNSSVLQNVKKRKH